MIWRDYNRLKGKRQKEKVRGEGEGALFLEGGHAGPSHRIGVPNNTVILFLPDASSDLGGFEDSVGGRLAGLPEEIGA